MPSSISKLRDSFNATSFLVRTAADSYGRIRFFTLETVKLHGEVARWKLLDGVFTGNVDMVVCLEIIPFGDGTINRETFSKFSSVDAAGIALRCILLLIIALALTKTERYRLYRKDLKSRAKYEKQIPLTK